VSAGVIARKGEGEFGARWTERTHSTENDAGVGQVLQTIVWWFRVTPMDWSYPMLHRLFHPSQYG